ncbi:hypothetical protein F5Y15DRAFT_139088 [Xylariaceae sp. FL0016]|nr:hypothetical protein F5Y15DRAFT_139088 [Xylariaceae sp. FL0016]
MSQVKFDWDQEDTQLDLTAFWSNDQSPGVGDTLTGVDLSLSTAGDQFFDQPLPAPVPQASQQDCPTLPSIDDVLDSLDASDLPWNPEFEQEFTVQHSDAFTLPSAQQGQTRGSNALQESPGVPGFINPLNISSDVPANITQQPTSIAQQLQNQIPPLGDLTLPDLTFPDLAMPTTSSLPTLLPQSDPTFLVPDVFAFRPGMPHAAPVALNQNIDPFIAPLKKSSSGPPSPIIGLNVRTPSTSPSSTDPRGPGYRTDTIPCVKHANKGHRITNEEAEAWYPPQPQLPSWGPRVKGGNLFEYTRKGELAPKIRLSKSQMRQYLYGPAPNESWKMPAPRPGVPVLANKLRQGLTLWIGWPASQSNHRYPRERESTKCRFDNCPASRNTIEAGTLWVIFDERHNQSATVIDPFQNAGYAHLQCLEENFDLLHLWDHVNIEVDNRDFIYEGQGHFKLSRNITNPKRLVKQWYNREKAKLQDAQKVADARGSERPRRNRDKDSSLWYFLFKNKNESAGRRASREKRKREQGHISSDVYDGDIRLGAQLKLERRVKMAKICAGSVQGDVEFDLPEEEPEIEEQAVLNVHLHEDPKFGYNPMPIGALLNPISGSTAASYGQVHQASYPEHIDLTLLNSPAPENILSRQATRKNTAKRTRDGAEAEKPNPKRSRPEPQNNEVSQQMTRMSATKRTRDEAEAEDAQLVAEGGITVPSTSSEPSPKRPRAEPQETEAGGVNTANVAVADGADAERFETLWADSSSPSTTVPEPAAETIDTFQANNHTSKFDETDPRWVPSNTVEIKNEASDPGESLPQDSADEELFVSSEADALDKELDELFG